MSLLDEKVEDGSNPPLVVEEDIQTDVATLPVKPKCKAHALPSKTVKDVASAAAPGVKISATAQVALEKAAVMSLFYLTCLADEERTKNSKRSTLQAQDIRAALEAAGMHHIESKMEARYKRSRT